MHAFSACTLALLCFLMPPIQGAIAPVASAFETGFRPERAGFSITFEGLTSDKALMSTTILPGQTLEVDGGMRADAAHGILRSRGNARWTWQAPEEPGMVELWFEQNGEQIKLNVFVLTPWPNGPDDRLNGFRVGQYDQVPYRNLDSYRAPQGLIEVTPDMLDIRVTPHFTLGQFLCKQESGHDDRAYALIRPALLMKLERLLESVNEAGFGTETLHVMSGYRTPWYNAVIGNTTTSSRHLYGGAADVFVDTDGDGWMDDLNRDGKIDILDANVLAAMAESLEEDIPQSEWPDGGIGIYRANAIHGPFVHIDARGYPARW